MANAIIGAELRLEGEKDFKRAVSSINTDLKVLGSELKKTESEYKGNENSLSALTAKSEKYSQIAEEQRKKIEILQTAVEKSHQKYTSAGQNVEKYRKELSGAEQELDRLKNSEDATTDEVKQQEKAVAELTKKLETAERGYSTAEKQTKSWEISLNRAEAELNDTQRELDETNKKLREMGESSRYSEEQIRNAKSTLSEYGAKAKPIADGFKAAFKAVVAVGAATAGASAAVIKKSVDIGSGFEAQMSKVQAVSGATAGDMEKLTAKAKALGGTTKFTAKQAGEALEYMSMAGWKTADMLSGIDGVMNLAAASGEDLGRTSDIVTDALTAFGMTADKAGHFADVLAAASSNANTNVGMMGETFKYVGAMAGTLGYSAEDVGLSIGLMANAGIKASQAGTELNSIYTRLSVNTSHARDAIEGLGIQFYDSNGKARSWGTILDEMRIKTAKMTDAEKTAFANRVAGQRAQAGLLAMLNATSADYDNLTKSINNADGAAKRMADTMQDNLQGQLTVLKSGLEGAAISIYDEMQKPLTEGVKTFVSTLNDPRIQTGIKSFGKTFGEMFGGGAKLAAKYAPDFIKGFQKVTAYLSSSSFKSGVKAGGELLMNTGKVAVDLGKTAFPVLAKGTELLAKSGKVLVPVLAAGYAGFKAFQIVKSVTELVQGAGAAFQALNVVMMANPWALAIGGAAALAVALIGLNATLGRSEDKYKELDDSIHETSDSMRDMANARKDAYDSQYREIYQVESLRKQLSELVDSNGKLVGKKEELKAVTNKLNEYGFKVELDKTGTLIKNYKELNKQITDYISSKQYEAKMSALDSEYKKYSVEKTKYHDRTKQARQAYEEQTEEFGKYSFNRNVDIDPSRLYDKEGNQTDYYWEKRREVRASPGGSRMEDEFVKQAAEIQKRSQELEEAAAAEDKALKLIDAVEQAYLLGNEGKYAEANKVLQNYFDDRNTTFKRAESYDKNQRKQAIDDLGNQLKEEVELHRAYLDTGSQEMISASIGYIKQAAAELAKVGVEIPDSIAEGLENGTLTVDQAMAQIEQILKESGKVDLTEEGKEASRSLIGGFNSGGDDAEEAGTSLKDRFLSAAKGKTGDAEEAGTSLRDSLLNPLGSPTPKAQAEQYGRETAGAYSAGVDSRKGTAKSAGDDVADSTVKGLGSGDGGAENAGRQTGDLYSTGIDSRKGKARQAGSDAGDAAVKGMVSVKASASAGGQTIGGAFGSGISVGIKRWTVSVNRSVMDMVNGAVTAAKKAAGINSPSKRAADEIGKPLPQGVAVGIERGSKDAARRAAASTNAIIEKMKAASASAAARLGDPGSLGSFGRAAAGNAGNKTINITYENTFHSASARDGDTLIRQIDRYLGAKL